MAQYAIGQAIEALTEKRNALRAKAKEYQNRRQRSGVCIRTRNLLLNCAQLTVTILALRNNMMGGAI